MVFYEINTGTWLHSLQERYGREVTLGDVPGPEWDRLGALGVDAIWLMGVWERSPQGVRIASELAELRQFPPADITGSPYCIRDYSVDARFGGNGGLAAARFELARRGLRLILDFVPNHVARDHDWVAEHPEFFIAGVPSECCFEAGGHLIACARDPYFPAWTDVAQLNAYSPGMRAAALATLDDIAGRCDGVRCDMAMLMLSEVFARTWGLRSGPQPATEYWSDLIPPLKERYRGFLFLAEAYWDKEYDLQQLGFDFCYDKRLYDRMRNEDAGAIRAHLGASLEYQQRLLRFIENHDEPRAAAVFGDGKSRAAAACVVLIPGGTLIHEGQMSGARVKLPVQIGRRPAETADADLERFYRQLFSIAQREARRSGEWDLAESSPPLLAWCWRSAAERLLVVLNWSEDRCQGRVRFHGAPFAGRIWQWTDLLTGAVFPRDGAEMDAAGLFVDLPAWGIHIWTG